MCCFFIAQIYINKSIIYEMMVFLNAFLYVVRAFLYRIGLLYDLITHPEIFEENVIKEEGHFSDTLCVTLSNPYLEEAKCRSTTYQTWTHYCSSIRMLSYRLYFVPGGKIRRKLEK